VCAALERWSGEDLDEIEVLEARSAIDLAMWDLEGRRLGVPVWKLLGATAALPVEVSATFTGSAEVAGFGCVKVKVGLADDDERLVAVREAVGPSVAIRIDANGAWSVDEAVSGLRQLSVVGIELCEEPVHGLSEIARVASAVPVPIALDESTALDGALETRVCDAVCLKVARCGGISGLVEAAERARAVGYRVYLGSTLDGPLAIAAALHAAAAVRPELACGLATLDLFERPHGPRASGGRLAPPPGPGLGDGLIGWYGG
jgi:L-alanine-DL-glutamate epimerase-like enolase superfamily enzyme